MCWRVTSLFSGIECFREALHILDSAVAAKFGFQLDFKYRLMVPCQELSSLYMYCHPDVTWYLSKGILSSPLLLTEVEKSNACNKALIEHYPDTCVMRDVFDLLKRYPKSQTWKAHKLCLTDCFQCCNHAEQFLRQHSKFNDYITSYVYLWLPVWCQRYYTIISVHSKVPFGLGGWCGWNTGGPVHIPQQESWPDMWRMFTCNFLI